MYYPDNEEKKTTEQNETELTPSDETENAEEKQDVDVTPEGETEKTEENAGDAASDDSAENVSAEAEDEPAAQEEEAGEEPAPEKDFEKVTSENGSDGGTTPPKKRKTYISGGAIAVIVLCAILFAAIVGFGSWKIATSQTSSGTQTEATADPADTAKTNESTKPTEPSQTAETTSENGVTPAATSVDMSGAAVSPESTKTSDTTSAQTKVIEKALKSVVEIDLYKGETAVVGGSGVIYTTDGYIITNYHVTSNTDLTNYTIIVTLNDGSKYQALFVCGDMESDIAVIKIDKDDCTAATIGNSDATLIGEAVFAIGNSNGEGTSVTSGCISMKGQSSSFRSTTYTVMLDELFVTDAVINAGNSGGGLFNAKGELIGIVNGKSMYDKNGSVIEGRTYAISIAHALECVNTLAANNGYIPGRAKLGVTMNTVTFRYSYYATITYSTLVTAVNENSTASQAGILAGDVITEIDGIDLVEFASKNNLISDYDALQLLLRNYSVGDSIKVTLLRAQETDGRTSTYSELTIDVTFIDFNYSIIAK